MDLRTPPDPVFPLAADGLKVPGVKGSPSGSNPVSPTIRHRAPDQRETAGQGLFASVAVITLVITIEWAPGTIWGPH